MKRKKMATVYSGSHGERLISDPTPAHLSRRDAAYDGTAWRLWHSGEVYIGSTTDENAAVRWVAEGVRP